VRRRFKIRSSVRAYCVNDSRPTKQNLTLQQKLQELRLKAEQERVAQESYVRGVEDRAHREVDLAREEGKRRTAQVKEAGHQLEQLQQRIEGVQVALSQAKKTPLHSRRGAIRWSSS
jgi:triphosphoribosyl-dephospho-CoA synthetase